MSCHFGYNDVVWYLRQGRHWGTVHDCAVFRIVTVHSVMIIPCCKSRHIYLFATGKEVIGVPHMWYSAVFWIPITSPSCQHFMHFRLLTHVSSPFDDISLRISSLFWLTLHLTDLSLMPRLWMKNYASFPYVCLHGLDWNDFTPSLLYPSSVSWF